MRFKKTLQYPGARRTGAGHHHGSDTPTSARAILYHTDQKEPNIMHPSVTTTSDLTHSWKSTYSLKKSFQGKVYSEDRFVNYTISYIQLQNVIYLRQEGLFSKNGYLLFCNYFNYLFLARHFLHLTKIQS